MFISPKLSLSDILGRGYTDAIARANDFLGVMSYEESMAIADEKIDFYPEEKQKKNDALLEKVGTQIIEPFANDLKGAATNAFKNATNTALSPVTGFGNFRIGEDGKLYLVGKSEHYHTPLGHRFDGYKLIDNARKLGVLNATHNNTRGYITRLMERRIVQMANGIDWDDEAAADAIINSDDENVLNRVINLETGSLACEAGLKMMLARFYKLDPTFPEPKYAGKIPVFFIMGDTKGGIEANYHGTTVVAQTLRGLWPQIREKADNEGLYKVVPVSINDLGDFEEKIKKYNSGNYKTCGFSHEIILMNYGGIRLTKEFLQGAYALCREYDTPTMCDEIQSCMWYEGAFLFRLYGLTPDFSIVGKGFPGGEYPASKIITNAKMDTLNQFGALVTNGQEELASLAYLITMTFMRANGAIVSSLGKRFDAGLKAIAAKYPEKLVCAEGLELLAALHFNTVDEAAAFAGKMKGACIDSSVMLYKANCVPALLMKPPFIASEATIDYILNTIDTLLGE
ncbi:MAG: aminotransferase class III-fold pyridoxal phosphate-dependent enzyme [Ruminococcaceae bacterium]|nr:aminotransferase class III-fold pyridoxal phosphate-dependent enzyme [Oscillospiraceae bacterium]